MADKLFAEWFWIDRWMGSRAFALPLQARGLYREMLSQAWLRGAALPNDPDQIRRMAGVSLKEWRQSWPMVEQFWRVDGSQLVNDTQLDVYADAKGRVERAQARGRAGAQARHKRGSSGAQAVASVSDLCTPVVHPLPPQGGRPTRAERKTAKTIRAQRFGRCQHEPPCADAAACERAIIAELRAHAS